MSAIATAVKHMLAAGMAHDMIVAAVGEMEECAGAKASSAALRSERNRRHYEKKKAEREASENRLNPSEQDVSDTFQTVSDGSDAGTLLAHDTPSRGIENTKTPLKGGKKIADAIHPLPISEAFEAWNLMAVSAGLQTVRDHSSKRVRALQARLREVGLDGWLETLSLVAASQFLTGKNDRQWRASFDFVSKAESFAKIREGVYSKPGDRKPVPITGQALEKTDADWTRHLQYARQTNKWWVDDWGPMPGDTGCRVPEHLISDDDRSCNFVPRRNAA